MKEPWYLNKMETHGVCVTTDKLYYDVFIIINDKKKILYYSLLFIILLWILLIIIIIAIDTWKRYMGISFIYVHTRISPGTHYELPRNFNSCIYLSYAPNFVKLFNRKPMFTTGVNVHNMRTAFLCIFWYIKVVHGLFLRLGIL